MQIEKIQKQKENMFKEFMEVTFLLSEEELQAVHGVIPMTQEIYERCARKCEEEGAVRQLEELIAAFPEQQRRYRGKKQSMEENPAGRPEGASQDDPAVRELSKEELQSDEVWKKINSQLEKME